MGTLPNFEKRGKMQYDWCSHRHVILLQASQMVYDVNIGKRDPISFEFTNKDGYARDLGCLKVE